MRKAGELLKSVLNKAGDFDAAYAQKIDDLGMKYAPGSRAKTAVGTLAGSPLRSMSIEFDEQDTAMDKLLFGSILGGIGASNVGIRYGIPLAGAGALANGIGNAYDALSGVPVIPQDQTNPPVGY